MSPSYSSSPAHLLPVFGYISLNFGKISEIVWIENTWRINWIFFDCIASSLTPTKNITDEGSYWVLISCAIIAKIEGHLEESKSGFYDLLPKYSSRISLEIRKLFSWGWYCLIDCNSLGFMEDSPHIFYFSEEIGLEFANLCLPNILLEI